MVVDERAPGAPVSLAELPAGDYNAQAVIDVYEQVHRADGKTMVHMNDGSVEFVSIAGGNLYSDVVPVHVGTGGVVRLALTHVIPPQPKPADTEWLKHVTIRSALLTKFWGRPVTRRRGTTESQEGKTMSGNPERSSLERDVRWLKRYAAVSTAAMAILLVGAFTRGERQQKFDVIDVQRINVVEPDGSYRMVISNRARSIGPIYKGKPFGYAGGNRPGIIFFNDEGSENGGLSLSGRRRPDGTYAASTHLSFDQFGQDQVLNLDYRDDNGRRLVGLSVDDRADVDILQLVRERDSIMSMADTVAREAALRRWAGPRNGVPLAARRLFVGRDPSKAAVLNLNDRDGHTRLRLSVDSLGAARVEFLDPTGKVTRTFTGDSLLSH